MSDTVLNKEELMDFINDALQEAADDMELNVSTLEVMRLATALTLEFEANVKVTTIEGGLSLEREL